jgi:hypothetical protein
MGYGRHRRAKRDVFDRDSIAWAKPAAQNTCYRLFMRVEEPPLLLPQVAINFCINRDCRFDRFRRDLDR